MAGDAQSAWVLRKRGNGNTCEYCQCLPCGAWTSIYFENSLGHSNVKSRLDTTGLGLIFFSQKGGNNHLLSCKFHINLCGLNVCMVWHRWTFILSMPQGGLHGAENKSSWVIGDGHCSPAPAFSPPFSHCSPSSIPSVLTKSLMPSGECL